MMALAEKLRQRAALQGRTAAVDCGELGVLTVEALPLRELELLYRGSDGARAVFYAACRELQAAGEELRRAGQVYAPDGILQFVSQAEAEAAARVVLELSGYVPAEPAPVSAGEAAEDPAPEVRADAVPPVTGSAETPLSGEQEETLPAPPAADTVPVDDLPSRPTDTASASEALPRAVSPLPVSAGASPPAQRTTPSFQQLSAGKAMALPADTLLPGKATPLPADTLLSGKATPLPEDTLLSGRTTSLAADTLLPGRTTPLPADTLLPGKPPALPQRQGSETAPLPEISRQSPPDREESPSAEALARQLLEGLRRANWVRGG